MRLLGKEKYRIPELKVLLWRLEYIQRCMNEIETVLYSEMSKEKSLELIRKKLKGINRATKSE